MLYVDTSAIVKLYVREALSMETSDFIRKNDQAIPLTRFHELEFPNALLKKTADSIRDFLNHPIFAHKTCQQK